VLGVRVAGASRGPPLAWIKSLRVLGVHPAGKEKLDENAVNFLFGKDLKIKRNENGWHNFKGRRPAGSFGGSAPDPHR